MLASLAGYNMLSYMNKNVYILVVNPSKYFSNHLVGEHANNFQLFFEFFLMGDFVFGFFSNE